MNSPTQSSVFSPQQLSQTDQTPEPARWLVTGGCGFIGTNLIKALVAEGGHFVRVLDNLSAGTKDDLARVCNFAEKERSLAHCPECCAVELVVGDIRDLETCLSACTDIDVVIHLAANTGVAPSVENPRGDMEANVIGTFNMLEAARQKKVCKFIFASSGAPLGEVEPPIDERIAPRPVSPYGASKLAGEGYCSAYFRTFGLKTVALRFGNVYGPGSKRKSSVVASFFRRALNDETLEVYGDGNQTRDFIYIDDLIRAIRLAVNRLPFGQLSPSLGSPWGEVFQIATHKETTVNDIANSIRDLIEKETGRKVSVAYSEPRLGDVRRNYSDITKAKTVLGYEPEFDLDKGLRHTFAYFGGKL